MMKFAAPVLLAMVLSLGAVPALAEEPAPPSTAQKAKAAVKDGGRSVGHAARDVTRAIGHGTRDATKAIGHGTRDAVHSIGDGAKKAWDDTAR
ncbi:MAG: hypothetical protein RLZZ501_2023 [Pseudomonadota bacterium]